MRFPKGKKVKQGDYVTDSLGEDAASQKAARLAARDRAVRRTNITTELLNDEINDSVPDISKAEVRYKVKSSDGSCMLFLWCLLLSYWK